MLSKKALNCTGEEVLEPKDNGRNRRQEAARLIADGAPWYVVKVRLPVSWLGIC